MPPFPILLANRARLTQETVHESIHEWLTGHAGFRNVRYAPSRIRREEVHAEVEPDVLLETDYDVPEDKPGFRTSRRLARETPTVRLEVQFEFPQSAAYDYYRIQWVEPDSDWSVGWHQDDHRNGLGECHRQLDFGNEVADVRAAEFLDSHPLNVLETRLGQLPDVLDGISWKKDSPQFDC